MLPILPRIFNSFGPLFSMINQHFTLPYSRLKNFLLTGFYHCLLSVLFGAWMNHFVLQLETVERQEKEEETAEINKQAKKKDATGRGAGKKKKVRIKENKFEIRAEYGNNLIRKTHDTREVQFFRLNEGSLLLMFSK